MSDAFCSQKNGIEEVRVCIASVVEGLACVEDERQIEAQFPDLGSHFKKVWDPVCEWVSRVFLALHIESYHIFF